MANKTLLQQAKELEAGIRKALSEVVIDDLPPDQRDLTRQIINQAIDVRLDIRAYEYAETRAEQRQQVSEARLRLANLQKDIIAASVYDLFSAIEIARISAEIEQIASQIE